MSNNFESVPSPLLGSACNQEAQIRGNVVSGECSGASFYAEHSGLTADNNLEAMAEGIVDSSTDRRHPSKMHNVGSNPTCLAKFI